MSAIMTATLNGTLQLGTTNIVSANDVAYARAFANIVSTTLSQSTTAENIVISVGSPLTVALPVSPAQLVYVRNLPTSQQTILVTWTPNGGSSTIVTSLTPGGLVLLLETATGGGITALTIGAASLTSTVEWIVAG